MERINQFIQNRLPIGSFAHNVVTLMTGTTLSQVLMILVAPILTRLYSPEDFGIFTLYISVLGTLTVIACWRYELAIVLPEKDEDAANLLALSVIICLGMAGLTFLLVKLFRYQLVNLIGAPKLVSWLWFMPLSLIAAGFFQAFNYWSTRRQQFKRLALRQVTQSTGTVTTQILLGVTYSDLGSGGLIGGSIVGQTAATSRLIWQIKKDEGCQIKTYISIVGIKRVLSRYKDFPLYSSWAILLNTISSLLPALLLGYFFSPVIVGYYGLGYRVLSIPMTVIGSSISQVFFPKATVANNTGELSLITITVFRQLVSIGLVPLLLLMIVAPKLFILMFGTQWEIAGEYARWMCPWLFFQFISSPLSTIYLVLEKQKAFLIFNILLVFTRLTAISVGGIFNDAHLSIVFFGLTGVVLYTINCCQIIYMTGVKVTSIFNILFNEIIKAIPFLLLPFLFSNLINNSLVYVISVLFLGIGFLILKTNLIKRNNVN